MSESSFDEKTLDTLLAQRAQQASELPWLELKVMSQVEYREQARQWLKSHPGGLSGRRPQPLKIRLWSLLSGLASARIWPVLGIVLMALAMAYLAYRLPLLNTVTRSVQPVTLGLLAACFATLAVALANWPRLRQFYS